MSKGIALTISFIGSLALNIIAPSFFGIHAHGALLMFLAALLLYFGVNESSLLWGLAFSFVGEILLGKPLGVVMFSFLAMAIVLFVMQRLVNSKPLVFDDGGFGSGVTAVVVGVFLAVTVVIAGSVAYYFIAGQAFAFKAWGSNYPVIGYYTATLVIFLVLLRLLSYKRQSV